MTDSRISSDVDADLVNLVIKMLEQGADYKLISLNTGVTVEEINNCLL